MDEQQETPQLPMPPTPMPPKTGDDHMVDLQAWLKERGLKMMIVAIGNKSGIPCSAKDWEPDTHRFTVMLVENNAANP